MISWIGGLWRDLIQSWPLLGDAWLSGWILAPLLAMLGVLVVARRQIFIGAAIAQSATAGVAAGLAGSIWISGSHRSHEAEAFLGAVCAILAGIAAALAVGFGASRRPGSLDGRTGWIYLVSAAAGVLLLAQDPHGSHLVSRLLASSLLGASAADAWIFAVLLGGTVLVTALARDRLALIAIDPGFAHSLGLHLRRWDLGIALTLGVAISLAIHASGLLYTFGCLVLPAMAARTICREVRSQFWVAPVIALLGVLPGFTIANHHDLPPGQVSVLILAFLVPLAWTLGRWRHPG